MSEIVNISAGWAREVDRRVRAMPGAEPTSNSRAPALPTLVRVRLTDYVAARGKYTGRVSRGVTAAIDATTDVYEGNVWIDPGADNCIVINPAEIAGPAGSHRINVLDGAVLTGQVIGLSAEATPRPIVSLLHTPGEYFFPVLVHQLGTSSDVAGTATTRSRLYYNAYAPDDTGYTTPLNIDPVEPLFGPATMFAGPVTRAPDGAMGQGVWVEGTFFLFCVMAEFHGSNVGCTP